MNEHLLIDLARAGRLWTGTEHDTLKRPAPPALAWRVAVARGANVKFIRTILRTLVEHEMALHTPTLLSNKAGFERVLRILDCPLSYRDVDQFESLLKLLLECDLLVEVPEADMLPLCGYVGRPPGPCLPQRQYWGEGARGFLVTPRGRRFAELP